MVEPLKASGNINPSRSASITKYDAVQPHAHGLPESDQFLANPHTKGPRRDRGRSVPRRKSVLLDERNSKKVNGQLWSGLASDATPKQKAAEAKKFSLTRGWRDFFDIPDEKPERERRQSVLETMTDAEIEAMAPRGSRWSDNLKSNYIALGLTAEDISHLSPGEQLKKRKEQEAWARRSEAALSRVDKKMRRESYQFQSLAKHSPIAARLGLQVEREFEAQAEQVALELQNSKRSSSSSLALKRASRGSGAAATAKGKRTSVFVHEGEGEGEGEPGDVGSPQVAPGRNNRLSTAWKSFLSTADAHTEEVAKRKASVMLAFPEATPAASGPQHPTYTARAPVNIPGGPDKGSKMSQAWGDFYQSVHVTGAGFQDDDDDDDDGIGGGDASSNAGAEDVVVTAAVKIETEFEDNSAALDTELTRSKRRSASILAAKLQNRASAALLDGMDGGDSAIIEEDDEDDEGGAGDDAGGADIVAGIIRLSHATDNAADGDDGTTGDDGSTRVKGSKMSRAWADMFEPANIKGSNEDLDDDGTSTASTFFTAAATAAPARASSYVSQTALGSTKPKQFGSRFPNAKKTAGAGSTATAAYASKPKQFGTRTVPPEGGKTAATVAAAAAAAPSGREPLTMFSSRKDAAAVVPSAGRGIE